MKEEWSVTVVINNSFKQSVLTSLDFFFPISFKLYDSFS